MAEENPSRRLASRGRAGQGAGHIGKLEGRMTKTLIVRLARIAPLALVASLSACGHSDSAADAASSDTVEMPAEAALSGVAATPAPDASATATLAPGADLAPPPAAAPAAAKPAPAPSAVDKD